MTGENIEVGCTPPPCRNYLNEIYIAHKKPHIPQLCFAFVTVEREPDLFVKAAERVYHNAFTF